MRADRLISLLMLLQVNGKMTARQLSNKLEVSERTIYRDIEALSASGVPVYAETGCEGGYALLDSYRTSLTGLNEAEARVLFMLSVPAPLARLGLSQELRRAMLKLTASLPTLQQSYEEQVRQRFYMDSVWWSQDDEPVPHLQIIYQAVWKDQKVAITYRPVPHVEVSYPVEPYALVAKAGSWHLVAAHEGKLQVYRVTALIGVRNLNERFTRLAGFDLQAFWTDWCEHKNRSRLAYPVQMRVPAGMLDLLPYFFGEELSQHIKQAGRPDTDGWLRLELCFASLESARQCLLPLGSGVEVLSPWALRRSMEDYAEQILKVYRNTGETDVK
jgi:predicted DNA-binding transcriptional regulator YafY